MNSVVIERLHGLRVNSVVIERLHGLRVTTAEMKQRQVPDEMCVNLCLTREIRQQAFPDQDVLVVGTGGFSRLFDRERLFDAVLPDLILIGLERALALNPDASRPWDEAAPSPAH